MTGVTLITIDPLLFNALEVELIESTFYYLSMCVGFNVLFHFFKLAYQSKKHKFNYCDGRDCDL